MMSEKEAASSQQHEEADCKAVPEDFPRPIYYGSLPGAQPKLLAVEYKGRFYVPGSTPPEICERWEICEDLAKQIAQKSVDSKAGKRAHMTEVEILEQYLLRLIAQRWISDAETRWVMRRVAQMLNWPAPPSALEV